MGRLLRRERCLISKLHWLISQNKMRSNFSRVSLEMRWMKLGPKEWWLIFRKLFHQKERLIRFKKEPFFTISTQTFILKKFILSSTKSWGNKMISTLSVEQVILIPQNTQNHCGQVIKLWTSIFILDCRAVWRPYYLQVWWGIRVLTVTLEGIMT